MAREAEASGLDIDGAAGPDPDGHGPASAVAVAVVSGAGVEVFAHRRLHSMDRRKPAASTAQAQNWFIAVMALAVARGSPPAPLDRTAL